MDIKPKNLLKRVLKFARDELERRARPHDEGAASHADSALPSDEVDAQLAAYQPMRARFDDDDAPSDADPEVARVRGLEVVRPHDGGLLTLRWSVTPEDVARAKRLIHGNPVLCVRLVSFSKGRDAVLREVQDRPGVDLVGDCEIGEPAARAVVSLGLRAGERFVSIAHHVI